MSLSKNKWPLPDILQDIPLLSTYAGDDGKFIRYAVDHGAKGLVIQGVGAGNVNKDVFHAIQYALNKKLPVVVATRVPYGGVYALYGDDGGGGSLLSIGAHLAGDLTAYKARLLLMITLSQPDMTPEKTEKGLFSSVIQGIRSRSIRETLLEKGFPNPPQKPVERVARCASQPSSRALSAQVFTSEINGYGDVVCVT